MNERGVEALVGAALRGVPQIKKVYADGRGGRCALGVLVWGDEHPANALIQYGIDAPGTGGKSLMCPHGCGYSGEEWYIVAHMNDDHGDDFLTIARKLGPDAA